MPNYPYYPVSYQPYQPIQPTMMYQQPNYAQQYAQAAQPQQTPAVSTPTISSTSIIWVASEKDASMYPIAPNNAVALWDSGKPVVYFKQADASGKPTMKIYDLVERVESSSTPSAGAGKESINYATKEELAAVLGAVKGYDGAINSIKSEIEKMSSDLYGIAGKKKTVTTAKKGEEDDA